MTRMMIRYDHGRIFKKDPFCFGNMFLTNASVDDPLYIYNLSTMNQ